jgi:hypothetical protein
MKKVMLGLLVGLSMTALSVSAQTANDNGGAVNAPQSLSGPFVPYGGAICPTGPVVAEFSGANTQDGRIFRDAIASVCPAKAYPGIFGEGTLFNFEEFTYSNTSDAAACVTVNFDPDTVGASPCATNAHMSAYLGSYDPTNQALNFVGDVGSSLAQPFSFEVPANSNLVLVATNTSSQAVCTFGFEVINLPCQEGGGEIPAGEAIDLPIGNTLVLALLGLLLAGLGFVAVRRRTQ